MKRSLLIAAAAATAVALLTGCSASTTSTEETSAPKPSATAETNPNKPAKPEPPKGSDPVLVSFTDIAVASCEKVVAEGGIAASDDVRMITVPAAKAIDKITDVAVVTSAAGKTSNYIIGPEPRTGEPMPFVCSISGSAYTDLMKDGKSASFSESGGVWTWKDGNMNATINIKNNMIDSFVQTVTQDGKEFSVKYAVTYGLTDADVKAFAEAVKNPTK